MWRRLRVLRLGLISVAGSGRGISSDALSSAPQCHRANDGANSLYAASDDLFDCILINVSMPLMNVLQATAAIRLLAQSAAAHAQRRDGSAPLAEQRRHVNA
jgi:hypothetical protein